LRLFIREYVFLYIARFGLQKLTDLQFNPDRIGGSVPSLEQKVCS
jgi:hypothetical protein